MSGELIGAAALISRYVVALVFLTAAIPKLVDRRELEHAVENYALLPRRLVHPVAHWLPVVELACGVALLLGVAVELLGAAAGILLLVFALAVGLNLLRGRQIDCGCRGSIAPRRIGWLLVAGDLLLAGMATLTAVADPGVLALVTIGSPSNTSFSDANAVAMLLLSSVLVLAFLMGSSWRALRGAEDAVLRSLEEVS